VDSIIVLIAAYVDTHDMKSVSNALDNIVVVKRRRPRILASLFK